MPDSSTTTKININVTPSLPSTPLTPPAAATAGSFDLELDDAVAQPEGTSISDDTITVPQGSHTLVFKLPGTGTDTFDSPYITFGSDQTKLLNNESAGSQGTTGTPFTVSSTSSKKISVTDSGADSGSSWYFALKINGSWQDPKVYNKGNG